MKTCWICNKRSVIQEFVWENGVCKLRNVCTNPYCRRYNPYIMYRIKPY